MDNQDRTFEDDEKEAHDALVGKKPVTIMQLAEFRGIQKVASERIKRVENREMSEGEGFTMGDFEAVGLPMIGGCVRCGACIAAYNASPTSTGYLACTNGCADDIGYKTPDEANRALFPEEYEWKGPKIQSSEL